MIEFDEYKKPLDPIPCLKRTEPTINANSSKYIWTTGADVQATWRRFGWTPVEREPREPS